MWVAFTTTVAVANAACFIFWLLFLIRNWNSKRI